MNRFIIFILFFLIFIKGYCEFFTLPRKLIEKESHLGIPRKNKFRPSHFPLITGDTFRSFADIIIDEANPHFETNSVKRGSIIFVGMPYIDFFLETVLPKIREKFILITSNGAGTIDEKYLKYLENPFLFKWFGRNMIIKHKKVCYIPLGSNWGMLKNHRIILKKYLNSLNINKYFAHKKYHTYLNFALVSHPSREIIFKSLVNQDFTYATNVVEYEKFLKIVANSRFVISPRGVNIDCFRHWEILLAGSIPVIETYGIERVFDDLPVIIVKDLSKITKDELDEKFNILKTKSFKLEKLHAKYWQELIRSAKHSCIHLPN